LVHLHFPEKGHWLARQDNIIITTSAQDKLQLSNDSRKWRESGPYNYFTYKYKTMDLKRSVQGLHFVCLFVEAQSQCRQSVKHQSLNNKLAQLQFYKILTTEYHIWSSSW